MSSKRVFLNNDVVFLKGQAMFVLFWVPVVLLSDLETFLVKQLYTWLAISDIMILIQVKGPCLVWQYRPIPWLQLQPTWCLIRSPLLLKVYQHPIQGYRGWCDPIQPRFKMKCLDALILFKQMEAKPQDFAVWMFLRWFSGFSSPQVQQRWVSRFSKIAQMTSHNSGESQIT